MQASADGVLLLLHPLAYLSSKAADRCCWGGGGKARGRVWGRAIVWVKARVKQQAAEISTQFLNLMVQSGTNRARPLSEESGHISYKAFWYPFGIPSGRPWSLKQGQKVNFVSDILVGSKFVKHCWILLPKSAPVPMILSYLFGNPLRRFQNNSLCVFRRFSFRADTVFFVSAKQKTGFF